MKYDELFFKIMVLLCLILILILSWSMANYNYLLFNTPVGRADILCPQEESYDWEVASETYFCRQLYFMNEDNECEYLTKCEKVL